MLSEGKKNLEEVLHLQPRICCVAFTIHTLRPHNSIFMESFVLLLSQNNQDVIGGGVGGGPRVGLKSLKMIKHYKTGQHK